MRKKEDLSKCKKNRFMFENFHIASVLLVLYDIVMSAGAYLAALWIRFDCQYSQIPQDYFMAWLKFMPAYAVICVFIFWLFKLYQSVWKYGKLLRACENGSSVADTRNLLYCRNHGDI